MFSWVQSALTSFKVQRLHSRGKSLVAKFEQGGGNNCIDEAIVLDREALELCPPGHPKRFESLTCLSIHLSDRYGQLGVMMDLEEAIVLDREALELRPPGHPDRSTSLNNLAVRLSTRYHQLRATEDLNEVIALGRDALALRPLGHPDRSMSLGNLTDCLSTRYKQLGAIEDLNEAIALDRDALVLCPSGDPDRSMSLYNLAFHLSRRYKRLGAIEDLNESVLLSRDALALCPLRHPDRSMFLNNLALRLSTRCEQLGTMEDLNEAIVLNQEALALHPSGHTDRAGFLSNLAICLSTRYNRLGEMEDLNEAIVLGQDALELCPPGGPDRSMFLSNLTGRLSTRYKRLGAMEDLNEAIVLGRDALMLRPPGHPGRSMSLGNLAVGLSTRYNQLGAMEDLNEAIALDRGALALSPRGHPGRSMLLNNLAVRLSSRYKQLGTMEDLNEAIALNQDALALRSPGHPDRSMSLNNLAFNLSTRYKQLGAMEDLNEAIVITRDALILRPPGHPGRPTSLTNLALYLSTRYQQLWEMEDLNEAIVLGRDALDIHPLGHPGRSESLNNLAAALSTRYQQLGKIEDINEAIGLGADALALCPLGHPDRSQSLKDLADYLYTRFIRRSRLDDKEELFSLYAKLAHMPQMVSSTDLFAARAWIHVAEEFQHPTTLLAYEMSLRLLIHHLATLPPLPRHLTVFKDLTSSLAVDAFSACLRNHSPTNAVELLEQGRGVFWSQLIRLRSPLDDVVASGSEGKILADEFTQLTSLIRNILKSRSDDQHDRVCSLNVELERVVTNIRNLPGLSCFLLPSLFSDLRQAAREGPVIIVNASDYGCDALVVLVDQDPVHIPLSITKKDVREMSSKFRALTVRAKSMDVTKDLCISLRKLWDEVVSLVVDFLQTIRPTQSRIWWCPTAEFSLLPLHAAGPFRKGQQKLADLYISSYTPTLAALIRARRDDLSNSATKAKRFVAIGQAKAKDENELVSVGAELAGIGRRIDGVTTAAFTCIEGPESCIARVTEELDKSDWAHFACHGIPNRKQPFDSAFALHDGRFTIQQIIQCNLENPEFAYLSACHTTVGDEESPDEVIHLASAMQFAGFRSVIGTMWAVDDSETNKITSMFYDNMKDESGRLDYTRAAYALNKTMKKLVDVPFDQRILYIHLGA